VGERTGQRLFNVSIGGTQVLTNFDIVAVAGAINKAVAETFPATSDSNGNITVAFNYGTNGYPLINGLQY